MATPARSGTTEDSGSPECRGLPIQMLKSSLRAVAKQRRSSLTADQRAQKSVAIMQRLLPLLSSCRTIMVYASKPLEVDTGWLIRHLLEEGRRVIVPIIVRENRSLRLSYLKDPKVLIESTFGVPEPIGNEIRALPDEVEIAIVPMLAFDASGNRLGYGAGYYDRFLRRYPHIRKVGVCFACQQVQRIPSNENDVRMDWIVTEEGVTDCRGVSRI